MRQQCAEREPVRSLAGTHAINALSSKSQPRFPVYVLIETDMVLVELEPQTFEVKLDREFLY
jgi:hypothetical protein